jgi:site-specific DNA recombinase
MTAVLGACRESNRGEVSVSLASQQADIMRWAAERGYPVAFIAADTATSGDISPAERACLGPWLTDPAKVAAWSILVTPRFDRLSRSTLDFALLRHWIDARGKTIVSVFEPCDLSTPEGSLMASNLVAMAEFERKRAGTNRGTVGTFIRTAGRWDGGRTPFGYQAIGTDGDYHLVVHDAQAAIARGMAEDAAAGKGLLTIARELNAAGIPASLGGQWTDNAVRRVLMSPALMGYAVTGRGAGIEILRDDNNQPVKFTDDPVLTEQAWEQVQDSIRSRSRARDEAQSRHLLSGIAFCGKCGGVLYGHRRQHYTIKGSRYACRQCSVSVRLDALEGYVEARVLAELGDDDAASWAALDTAGRNELLRSWGARFTVDAQGTITGHLLTIKELAGQDGPGLSHMLHPSRLRTAGPGAASRAFPCGRGATGGS